MQKKWAPASQNIPDQYALSLHEKYFEKEILLRKATFYRLENSKVVNSKDQERGHTAFLARNKAGTLYFSNIISAALKNRS